MISEARTEEALQACILDSQPVGILAFDLNSKIISWNIALEKSTGVQRETVMGKPLFDVLSFTSLSKEDLLSTLSGNLADGIIAVGESQFEVTASPILDNKQEVIGGTIMFVEPVFGSFSLSKTSKNSFKEVVEKSPLSTVIFNLDGSMFYSNNAYQQLWGISDENLNIVNQKYNIFKDEQLERNQMKPFILRAFQGETMMDAPVFKYQFSSQFANQKNEVSPVYWLKGYMFPVYDNLRNIEYVVLNFVNLTAQTEAKHARIKSEERLQLALEGGDLGTWDWDLQSGELNYSKRWADMLGYSLAEVHQIKWENLVHPEDIAWVKPLLSDCIDGKSAAYEAEYRILTKSGSYKWILDRGKVVEYDETGKRSQRASGTHLDITERKESERILKESEDKYRRLADSAPIGIVVISEEKIVYANKEALKMAGIKELPSNNDLDSSLFILDNNLSDAKDRQELVKSGKVAPAIETTFRRINGEEFEAEIVSMPTTYDGKPAVQSLVKDISEKKNSERELVRNEKRLMQLFDNSPLGIVMLDTDFAVLQINKGFENIFGFSIDDLRGKSLNAILVPRELQGEAEALNRSAHAGRIDYFESFRLNKEGSLIPVVIYALPVMDQNKAIGIYGIYVDIHERVRVEEELKTRNMELDHFVYKVSHDLRAPLASILGLINLTKLEKEPATQEYYVDLMRAQVEKLDQFIHDILSHSKNLNLDVVTSEIDFEVIIETCFSDLAYLDAASSITKSVDISGKGFISDKWRISEIFRNLISNAIKYSNPESNNKIVDIIVKVDKEQCKIVIKDNGMGISEEYLPQIFDMFYRGTDRSDGSGIGLYIVKNAIQKLNGQLSIDSAPHVGTTFTITIPAAIPDS